MRNAKLFRSPALTCAVVAWGLSATAAALAEEGAGGIEEVIVTAQRSEESIQDVPIAVTALTGGMLEDRQVITPSDLQMNAPSVSFTPTNFGSYSFSIRGIGRLVIGTTGEAGVSTHINEIPVTTNLTAIEFFDMERVEVLRGPQGTLYGRNATGGAINFLTAMPDYEKPSGFLDFEYGDYEHQRVKGMFNIPLGETAGLRVAGYKLDRDGYIKNRAFGQVGTDGSTLSGIDDDVDGRDITALRTTFAWDFSDRGNLWVQYSLFEEDDDRARISNQVCVRNSIPTTGCRPNEFGFESPHLGATTGGIFGGAAGALPFGVDGTDSSLYAFPRPTLDSFRETHTDFEPLYQDDEDLWLMGLTYEFDSFIVDLNGAYQERQFVARQDYLMDVGPTLGPTALNPQGVWPTSAPASTAAGGDWTSATCNLFDGTAGIFGGCVLGVDETRVFAYDQTDADSEYWTAEGRIQSTLEGPFNFQLGASAYDSESNNDYYVLANTLDLVGLYGSTALQAPPLYPTFFDNTSDPGGGTLQDGWAVFGEAYFDITDSVKLTAGLRYNEDNKEVNDTSVLFNSINVAALAPALGLPPGSFGADPIWLRPALFSALAGGPPPDPRLLEYWGAEQAYADNAAAFAGGFGALLGGDLSGIAAMVEAMQGLAAAIPPVPGFGETRFVTGSPSEATWDEFSGRVGIDWQISNDSMVYGFFSRGYKPGGFNPAIPPAFQATSSFTFAHEQVDSIEIGTKNTFLDGRLVLNGTFFLYDYGGLQVTRIANNSSINDNIDSDIMGVEIEGTWRPEALPGLSVDFGYGWLDAEVSGSESVDPVNRTGGDADFILLNNIDPGSLTGVNYVARQSQITGEVVDAALAAGSALDIRNGATVQSVSYAPDANGVSIPAYFSRAFLAENGVETSDGIPVGLDGNQLPNSPEHSIRLGLAYTWPISALRGSLTARWDYYWQDDSYAREFNSVGDEIADWDQHNATLIYESDDGRWVARAWVRNISDEENVTGKYLTSDTSGFFRNYFVTEPRIFGASLRFNFGG